MASLFRERRKTARVTVPPGVRLERLLIVTVRVLDISAKGVMMASGQPLTVGQIAKLRMKLAYQPIEANIEVWRVVPADGPTRSYRIAARFVGLDEATSRIVKQFVAERQR